MNTFTHMLAFMSATFFQAKDRHEERGATAVEYGLLVALIAAVIIAAVLLLGNNILDGFKDTNDELQKRPGAPAAAS